MPILSPRTKSKAKRTISLPKTLRKTKSMDLSQTKDALKQAMESSVFLRDHSPMFADFYGPEDVKVGRLLGSGAFYAVHKVKLKSPQDPSDSISDVSSSDDGEDKDELNISYKANKNSEADYVLRRMKCARGKSEDIVIQATLRLVLEAKYLVRLRHSNIIRVKGLASDEETVFNGGRMQDFFVIRERLVETLASRLKRWKTKASLRSESEKDALGSDFLGESFVKKAGLAMDIARALDYLHKRGIMVLNLSPNTIGFLKDGTLQITDLSCCQEEALQSKAQAGVDPNSKGAIGFDLPMASDQKNGSQSLMEAAKSNFLVLSASSDGGVPRYVAPEAITDGIYTTKADTYSWALIFFELLSLHKPYASYKSGQHLIRVCMEDRRPNLCSHKLPGEVQSMLSVSWDRRWNKRPPMSALKEAIPMLIKLRSSVVANPQA